MQRPSVHTRPAPLNPFMILACGLLSWLALGLVFWFICLVWIGLTSGSPLVMFLVLFVAGYLLGARSRQEVDEMPAPGNTGPGYPSKPTGLR